MTKRAYKYRFYPTDEQVRNLACTFGCCRFVYNWALSTSKVSYFQHGVTMNYRTLSHALTLLKKQEGTCWLTDVSSVPLQQALRHLQRAYTNFFEGRAEYPNFKNKHGVQSATYTDNAFTWDGKTLMLAKQSDPLDIVWSRPFPANAKPSSVTVSKDKRERYFVSLLVEETIELLPTTDKAIGIDVGLKSFLITSDGEMVANPKYYVRDEKKLVTAQCCYAKKQKGSKNCEKARKKVARLHARIADTRRDF